MFKKQLLGITFLLFFMLGCSTIINKKNTQLPGGKKYAIASFWNYTETPMAGLRASSIVESVLAQKNIALVSLVGGSDEMEEVKSKALFLKQKKEEALEMKADYLVIGNVQEWRYKTGIDGEPVVSYSIKVVDLKNSNIVFNGVGAKSGWGHKSIGVVAQEIAKVLIPQFVP
jgi:hypothetical protein